MKYYDLKNKPILRANFSPDMSADFAPVLLSPSSAETSVGILWNAHELEVTLISDTAERYLFETEGFTKKFDSSGKQTKLRVDLEKTDLELGDAEQLIPITVRAFSTEGEASFIGFARLCEYVPFYSFNGDVAKKAVAGSVTKAKGNPEVDPETLDLGAELKGDALRLYDLYREGHENYRYTDINIKDLNVGFVQGAPLLFNVDVTINSMPTMDYYSVTGNNGAYGLTFMFSYGEGKDCPWFGIQNSPLGLFAFTNIGFHNSIQIPRAVGDTFNFSVKLTPSRSLDVYIDGEHLITFPSPICTREVFGEGGFMISWLRSRYVAESEKDSFDVELRNLTISYEHTFSATSTYGINELMKNNEIVTAGADNIYLAPERLELDRSIKNDRLGLATKLIWKSSDTSVLSDDGIFKAPEGSGKIARLTAYSTSGDFITFEKTFTFFKAGKAPLKKVMAIPDDKDPFVGQAEYMDTGFVFDMNENSVVYDMGEIVPINRAELHASSELIDLLMKSFVSLYWSEDNVSYNYVSDFSMIQKSQSVYFYNFNVNARYLKLHSTARKFTSETNSIVNSLADLMVAYYSDAPILSTGDFKKETSLTLENDTDSAIVDKICRYSLSALGIDTAELRDDLADIRVMAGGSFLPQYYMNGVLCFRVPRLEPHTALHIRVLYGNPEAESVYDGNEVFEVQYGTRFTKKHVGSWRNSVAEMPDGSILLMGGIGKNGIYYERSTDGGHTWSSSVMAEHTEGISDGGGFLVDKEEGKVFYFAHQYDLSVPWCKFKILTSYDSGYTWQPAIEVIDQSEYLISYSDAIKLSCYDGDGPEVDYVFTTGMMKNMKAESFCTTSIYSRDGGKTWHQSKSRINYCALDDGIEMGLSEETVYEKKDGTLILYARCQYPQIINFAIAYSYDHGVTWTNVDHFSNVYTPNTQPIITPLDETPTLLWGGNNSIGGSSYKRFPLNLAYSNDECETFVGTQDVSFATPIATVMGKVHNVINPDLTFYKYRDVDFSYMVIPEDEIRIADIKRFLYNTKGAFDSFENGSALSEGWVVICGEPYASELGATDGKLAMGLGSVTAVSRSVTYTKKGSLEFDLYVENIGKGTDIELQSAYNPYVGVTVPVGFSVESDGRIVTYDKDRATVETGLCVAVGNNTVRIDFDSDKTSALLTVNGKSAEIGFHTSRGEAVCFVNIWNRSRSSIAIDRFILEKMD